MVAKAGHSTNVPVISRAASPKRAFKVPPQLARFQAVHVNTVVLASGERIAKLARELYFGTDKLSAYLEALRTMKWNDKISPFKDMKQEGLEFGRFLVKFSPSPEAKPVFLIFLAEKPLIGALKPGHEQVIQVVHRGKMKPVVFDRFITSRHDLQDTYQEGIDDRLVVITAESTSGKYRSSRPGRHYPYVGNGFQIEILFKNPRVKEDKREE
jgi:hypothetical protein